MEIKIIKYILCALLLTFAFTSCDKNEEAIATLENPKQSILTFKTFDEYNETLSKVNAMSKAERLVWENEQGFKSFGTICDEFYETIDPKSFKSVDEVKSFVLKKTVIKLSYISAQMEKPTVLLKNLKMRSALL